MGREHGAGARQGYTLIEVALCIRPLALRATMSPSGDSNPRGAACRHQNSPTSGVWSPRATSANCSSASTSPALRPSSSGLCTGLSRRTADDGRPGRARRTLGGGCPTGHGGAHCVRVRGSRPIGGERPGAGRRRAHWLSELRWNKLTTGRHEDLADLEASARDNRATTRVVTIFRRIEEKPRVDQCTKPEGAPIDERVLKIPMICSSVKRGFHIGQTLRPLPRP